MTTYFIRRFLLVPVTFFCITFLVYAVIRNAPGGPIEQAELRMKMAASTEGGMGVGSDTQDLQLTEDQLEGLRKYYHLDKSTPIGYLVWLGLWPRDSGSFDGILQGNFGKSHELNEGVLGIIVSKFHISLYFGLIGYFLGWIVCVPLGVLKAIKHRTFVDTSTSILVFIGYSIPGFVACLLLMVAVGQIEIETVAGPRPLLPLGSFRDADWDQWWAAGQYGRCVWDQIQHTVIPVIGYMIGGFATMTILMKNSLLENLGADYVRTAFAKGLSEKRVIFVHALRNSLIPITAGIGHALGLLFAGSFLIEKTCNIHGMGLLGYESILSRDYPITMGILVFLVLIRLTGNIFSDMVWALVDPRIRFGS
ncbi:ABC transporter permease [Planctomycetota bacterium]